MEIVIAIAAFTASLLTLFSGFGLGTILTPIFGIFFPLNIAVALTGIVHLLNNLFKLTILGKKASKDLVLRFGIPSVIGGFVGAIGLVLLSQLRPLFTWECFDKIMEVSLLKLAISTLMILFALMETFPTLKSLNFASRHLPVGGLLSGFFGGMSGHQGALRTAFLINLGLPKETFIATGVVIACMVDLIRLPVYFSLFSSESLINQWHLLLMATLSAFAGAYLGARFLRKTTLQTVQKLATAMIIGIALLLASGII